MRISEEWLTDRRACGEGLASFRAEFGSAAVPVDRVLADLRTAAPDGGKRTDWALWLADKTETDFTWPGFSYVGEKQHGRCRAWHPNGQVWWDAQYEGGKFQGRFREWGPNGQLRWDKTYEGGKRHGRYRAWHENGQLSLDATYEHGKLVKSWK